MREREIFTRTSFSSVLLVVLGVFFSIYSSFLSSLFSSSSLSFPSSALSFVAEEEEEEKRATRLLKTHRQHSNFVVFCRLVLLALWCRQYLGRRTPIVSPCLCSLAPAPPGARPLRPVTAVAAATAVAAFIFVLCRLFSFFPLDVRLRGEKTNYSYVLCIQVREYHHKCTNKHAAGTRIQSTLSTMLLNYDQSFLETDLYSSLKCVMHKLLECTNSSSASEVRTFSCAKSSTL